ncbi:MAG: ThiF family adenylyltransferase [Micropepsaceae bacterium]
MAFRRAHDNVAAWLANLCQAEALSARDLTAYPKRSFIAGWRLSFQFSDRVLRRDLLLPSAFPWQLPRVALVDRPPFLTWPHVEHDGVLCATPSTVSFDPFDPAGVAKFALEAAIELIEDLIANRLGAELSDEFLSYWDATADGSGVELISILEARPPSRSVRVWRGKNAYVFSESEDDLKRWLRNRVGKKADPRSDPAAFVWVGPAPSPADDPRSGRNLRDFIASRDQRAEGLLQDLARGRPDSIVLALGFETPNGPALAGVVAFPPIAQRHGARDRLTKGFRPGAVPTQILATRYFGESSVSRRSLERADAAWIHGRGQDPQAADLRGKTVAVFGCGSLGAPLALTLAQAGVGKMILIDFDILKWANVGRHTLGATSVGQFKAKALAEKLRADFPHMTVEHYDVDVDKALRQHGDVLSACDLVISATGDWASDVRLEAWREELKYKMPVVVGWLEAHACAGHVVVLGQTGACLRCGFDNLGVPAFRVTTWPAGSTEQREPACGAVYQPYGPVELGFVSSLVAEAALETLFGECTWPLHRIWVAPRKRLQSLGGAWSNTWRTDGEFRDGGGFLLERTWPAGACARCLKAQAA